MNKDYSKTHFGPNDWTNCEIATAYEKSKTMAEKVAWDFIQFLPENEKFELVTINPGFVLGPNLNECQFSSGDVVRDIMTRKMAMFPYVSYPMVDVRDVAQAHL